MDIALVLVLWIGATMMIGVIPTIHRHNTTKNLKQTGKDVHTLLTPSETIVHIARQGNISGWNDTVVATNNRIIIHRIKWRWWGKAVFEDVAWEDVQNATIDGMFGLANLHLTTTDGRKLLVGNLVKTQAQALLGIYNERTKQADAAKGEALSAKTDRDSQGARAINPTPKSVYCPNCGSESDESAKFCRDCGQALSAEEETTPEGQQERITKPEESPATLADYMSAKIQQMGSRGEAAPSPPLSSNTEALEKRDVIDAEEKRGQKPQASTKQVIGCLAIPAAIVLLIVIGTWGSDPVSDCYGSMGESIFKNAIKSRLNDPDSVQFHDTRTQEVEGQPRTAILVEYSAKNLFGGRVRKTAVGYLEETEGSACKPVIVSMG